MRKPGILFTKQFNKQFNCLCGTLLLLAASAPASVASKPNRHQAEIRIDVKESTPQPSTKAPLKTDKTGETKVDSASAKAADAKDAGAAASTTTAAPAAPTSADSSHSSTDAKGGAVSTGDLKGVPAADGGAATDHDGGASGKSESNTLPKAEVKTGSSESAKTEKKIEARPETYRVDYDIKPLKGKLNKIPVLNSNSPEIIPAEGILLSTLDGAQTKHPEAHLNYPIKGPLAIFFHHINRQEERGERKILTVSMLAYNPGSSKATLNFNSLTSYVSQPDAPVHSIEPMCPDDEGKIYAGQGDRVVSDYVRGSSVIDPPFSFNVPPHSYSLITDLPIKVYGASTLNGRTYYALAQSNKPLQFALLASFGPPEESSEIWHPESALANLNALKSLGTAGGESLHSPKKSGHARKSRRGAHTTDGDGSEAPTNRRLSTLVRWADDWDLAGPREGDKRAPTPPGSKQPIVYSRVSGVQTGTRIQSSHTLPLQQDAALAVAYPISTVEQGTLGTEEIQAAPLVKRYPNSAYAAHGNYCVHYSIDLKLVNKCKKARFVDLALSTPIKTDLAQSSLAYFKEQDKRVFFRGVIKLAEADEQGNVGKGAAHYYHVVSHRGEKVPPFAHLEIEAGATKQLRVELYYTPDATPPQVLTIDSPM